MSLLGALALQIWAFTFVALMGGELLATEPGLRVMAQVGWVAPVAVWGALRLRGPFTRLDWAILGALGGFGAVSLASADVQGSLDSLGLAVAYALAFWAMRAVGSVSRLRSAVAVGVSYALTGWLVMAAIFWIGEKVTWILATGTLPALESAQVFIWGTTNAFPIMALLVLPFIAWQRPGGARTALFVVWAVASAVVLPLSMGRAGWLGFLVALVALEALGGWPVTRALASALRARPLVAGATVFVGLAMVVVAVTVGAGLISGGVGGDRLRIWSQALAIFGADPLTGGGPGTFSWLRLAHVPDYTYAVPVRLAHDVPLQTLADGGLVLGVALGVLVTTFLATAWGRASDQRRRLSLAALIGFGIACLLDDFSSLPALMAVVVTLAAWVVAPDEEPVEGAARKPQRWILPAVVLALLAAAVPAVVGVDVARLAAADGRRAAVAGEWDTATSRFEGAVAAYPGTAGYWLGLGVTAWHAGDVDRARVAYQEALERNPDDARAAGALAALDPDTLGARALIDMAIRNGITDPQYAYRLGDLRRESGQEAAAVGAYGLAVAIDPGLISTFDGPHGPTQEDVAAAALDEAQRLEDIDGYVLRSNVAWDLGLWSGELSTDAPRPWQAVALALDGDLAKATEVAKDAMGEPLGLDAAAAVARIACDESRAHVIQGLIGSRLPLRPSEVRDVRDHTYRDQGLGTYQPLAEDPYPALPAWPWSLIGDPPDC